MKTQSNGKGKCENILNVLYLKKRKLIENRLCFFIGFLYTGDFVC